MEAIAAALSNLEVGRPVGEEIESLWMVPLLGRQPRKQRNYLTLEEAMQKGLFEVGEVSGTARVPELSVCNRADCPVLLLDGEILVGGKQDRVLSISMLIPAKTQLAIPVACVEEGRWGWRQTGKSSFSVGEGLLFAEARARKARDVVYSLRHCSQAAPDQHGIWEEVAAKLSHAKVDSPTRAASDLYRAKRRLLKDWEKAFAAQPGQIGAAFFVDGRMRGLDLFESEDA